MKMQVQKNIASHVRASLRICLANLLFALLCTSCGDKGSSGKKVFAYNQPEGLATLDPAFAKNQATMWVAHQLYNTLVETDSNLNIVPSLAKNWDASSDRLTYTF